MIAKINQQKRKKRVRGKIRENAWRFNLPRLTVFRSNKYIWAQIIDDKKGETLTQASEKDLKMKGREASKVERARKVGQLLAERALTFKIKKIVFDRGPYQYHGRIKALAEGVREGGLNF